MGNNNSFFISEKLRDTNDIQRIIEQIQRNSSPLNIPKTDLTVFLTSASEIYRLFLDTFDEVKTEITSPEHPQPSVICLIVRGDSLKESFLPPPADHHEIRNKLNQQLERVKIIFDKFILDLDGRHMATLTLEKEFNSE